VLLTLLAVELRGWRSGSDRQANLDHPLRQTEDRLDRATSLSHPRKRLAIYPILEVQGDAHFAYLIYRLPDVRVYKVESLGLLLKQHGLSRRCGSSYRHRTRLVDPTQPISIAARDLLVDCSAWIDFGECELSNIIPDIISLDDLP